MDLGVRGRAAFVAAGSRGLGFAIASELCAEGADVGLCARDEVSLAAAAERLTAFGTTVVATPADVTDAAAIRAAVDATADKLGRLDILVVNAGGPPAGTFDTVGDDDWTAALDLTLMSAVRLIRHALPLLRRSDAAAIVLVSSTSVRRPIANLTLSTSIRRAISGLVVSLASELAPHVRINAVLPGRITTERTISLATTAAIGSETPQQVMARNAAGIPLRRYGEPAELARAAVFLVSPAASYITGVELAVDGGALTAS